MATPPDTGEAWPRDGGRRCAPPDTGEAWPRPYFRSMSRHISEQFDAELERVRLLMLEMGGLVERQVRAAVTAFVTHDAALAAEVQVQERELNRLEVVLDDQCVRTIALRQPAARDLRVLVSIMKVGTDLERAGDEAERVAKMADQVSRLTPPADRYADVARMGQLVVNMCHGAMDAFARLNLVAAYEVMAQDAEVDALFSSIDESLSKADYQDPREVKRSFCIAWVARSLERIGDHAKNVCEHLVYQIEGTDVRHA